METTQDTAGAALSAIADDVVDAGFWRRWAALFLDQLVLVAAFYGAVFVVAIAAGIAGGLGWFDSIDADAPSTGIIVVYLGILAVYYVGAGLYFSLMESSRHQATLGKLALGIKTVDARGRRLSFGHAAGRWVAATLSYLTLYIGFLMAAFTRRKRALHDMVAGTLVVDRWAYTERPHLQRRELGGCLLAIIIGAALMIVIAVVGILAAIAIPAYQDYTHRAKISQAVVETLPLRSAVAEFVANEGRCPDAGDVGIDSASPQMPGRQVTVGRLEGGNCGIELQLDGIGAAELNDGRLWWELGQDGRWQCSSSVDDRLLPIECRG